MKWPFGGSQKTLKNGEQQEMQIITSRDAPHSSDWWADTSKLVYALSKGDRSTYVAATEQGRQGNKAVLLTVDGSVTDELWGRMVHMGYTREEPENVPEALRGKASAHSVTERGCREGLLFLGATQAQMNDNQGSAKVAAAFAKQFSKLTNHHRNCRAEVLHAMRDFLANGQNTLAVEVGSGRDRMLAHYAKAGAVRNNGEGLWTVVPEAVFNAPFLLDIFLHERGLIET